MARSRPGFVLPFSLVVTFVTMVIAGAGAMHYTSIARRSHEYVARTRCRLAAQSAIELAKLQIDRAVDLYTGGSSDLVSVGGDHIATSVQGLLADLIYASPTNIDGCVVRFGHDSTHVTDAGDGVNAIVPIYATATMEAAGRAVSVTLQECVSFSTAQSHVFDYAYFANDAGHLESRRIIVNGDVRANGAFRISGATVNGFVYSSGDVELSDSPQIWAAAKYNEQIAVDYAENGRLYAPVRPTSPPNPSDAESPEWYGGYDAPGAITTTTTITHKKYNNWWEMIFGGGTTVTETSTTTSNEMEIKKRVGGEGGTLSGSGKPIVSENIAPLFMPQVENLDDYRAMAARRGGSLRCDNLASDENGNAVQISMSYKIWSKDSATQTEWDGTYDQVLDHYEEVQVKTGQHSERRKTGSHEEWQKTGTKTTPAVTEWQWNAWAKMFDADKPQNVGNVYWGRDVVIEPEKTEDVYGWVTVDDYETVWIDDYTTERKPVYRQEPHMVPVQMVAAAGQGSLKTIERVVRPIYVTGGHTIDTSGDHPKDLSGDTGNLRPFLSKNDGGMNRATREADEGAVILIGSEDYPICITGPVVFASDVIISGNVRGHGTIYSGRNIHIVGDIICENPPSWPHPDTDPYACRAENSTKDLLALVCKGSIVFGDYTSSDWKTRVTQFINGGYRAYGNYTGVDAGFKKVTYEEAGTEQQESRNKSDWVWTTAKSSYRKDYNIGKSQYGYYKPKTVNIGGVTVGALNKYESVVGDFVAHELAPPDMETLGQMSTTDKSFWYWMSRLGKTVRHFLRARGWTERREVRLEFRDFVTDLVDYVFDSGRYGRTVSDEAGQFDPGDITEIDAVLYSSHGIFGMVGGENSGCTVNGAIIGRDECLLPYVAKYFSNKPFKINWDMRLKADGAEGLDSMGLPLGIKTPRTVSWQEVPDDFLPATQTGP